MEIIFRICLFIAGMINFIPSILAFLPSKIADSYGIELIDQNYELILRHRAVMLGIIGGIMICAAATKKFYNLSVVIGLISMVSFILFAYLVNGEINGELNKVLKMDVIATVILLAGFAVYKFG